MPLAQVWKKYLKKEPQNGFLTDNHDDLKKMTPTKKPPRTARPDGKTAEEAGKDTTTAKVS